MFYTLAEAEVLDLNVTKEVSSLKINVVSGCRGDLCRDSDGDFLF